MIDNSPGFVLVFYPQLRAGFPDTWHRARVRH